MLALYDLVSVGVSVVDIKVRRSRLPVFFLFRDSILKLLNAISVYEAVQDTTIFIPPRQMKRYGKDEERKRKNPTRTSFTPKLCGLHTAHSLLS